MKKPVVSFSVSEDFCFLFRTIVNSRLIYFTVYVCRDPEEVGIWHCRVFHLKFLALGRVQTLELHHSERIFHSSKGRPVVVARIALKHYLRVFESDGLPF